MKKPTIISGRVLLLALVGMLLAQAGLWWDISDGDPLPLSGAGGTERHLEAYWYAAEARAWVLDQPVLVPDEYRRPIVTWAYYGIFELAGANLRSVHALAGLASLATTVLLVLGIARTGQRRLAVLVGWICALHPIWNAGTITAYPSHLAALWGTAVLLLGAHGGVLRWGVAVALGAVGALWLHAGVGLGVVALAVEGWWRFTRRDAASTPRRSWAFPAGTALIVGLGFLALFAPHSSPAQLPWRQLPAESLFRSFPALTLWTLVSLLIWSTRKKSHRFDSALDRMTATLLPIGFAWASLQADGAVRSFIVVFPWLAYQASQLLERIAAFTALRPLPWASARGVGVLIASGVAGALLVTGWLRVLGESADQGESPWLWLFVLMSITIAFMTPLWVPRSRSVWAPVFGAVFLFVVWGGGWAVQLGHVRKTHAYTSQQLGALLLPTAVLSGPAAAALAFENTFPVTYSPESPGALAERAPFGVSSTHWCRIEETDEAIDRQFIGEEPIEFIEVLHVQSRPLRLYRFERTLGPRSAFEDAVRMVREREYPPAKELLSAVIAAWPSCSPAWTKLGNCMTAEDRPRGAYSCYQRAILAESGRAEAQLALASVFLTDRLYRQALFHLEAALESLPEHPLLTAEAKRLRRLVAQAPRSQ